MTIITGPSKYTPGCADGKAIWSVVTRILKMAVLPFKPIVVDQTASQFLKRRGCVRVSTKGMDT